MSQSRSLIRGPDGLQRCGWCGDDPLYVGYHDDEWGQPVDDDRRLFEKISLEGFQAGLSWLTILRKRPAFRAAFDDFDFEQISSFPPAKVDQLLGNRGIVRHRGKIESVINNARRALETAEKFGSLAAFFWQFEPGRSPTRRSQSQLPSVTAESTALSKELKRSGWSFVGPTTCYAFMQSMGLVNDHLRPCHRWQPIERARQQFTRPG